MKKLILTLAALTVSVSANASHFGEFDADALQAANIILKCPNEVAAIMSRPYTRITDGKYFGGMTPTGVATTYNFTFTQTLPMPSGKTTITTLQINEMIKRNQNPAPDAPGHTVEISCSVKVQK